MNYLIHPDRLEEIRTRARRGIADLVDSVAHDAHGLEDEELRVFVAERLRLAHMAAFRRLTRGPYPNRWYPSTDDIEAEVAQREAAMLAGR